MVSGCLGFVRDSQTIFGQCRLSTAPFVRNVSSFFQVIRSLSWTKGL